MDMVMVKKINGSFQCLKTLITDAIQQGMNHEGSSDEVPEILSLILYYVS